MSGQLTLTNSGESSLSDWSYTFRTTQKDVQVWSSTFDVVDLGDGTYEVTVRPPSWGASIPAGGSLTRGFNAVSVDLPNSGTLTNEMFFVDLSPSLAATVTSACRISPISFDPEFPQLREFTVFNPPSIEEGFCSEQG